VTIAVFGALTFLSSIATAILDRPFSMATFIVFIIGWLGMLYGLGINHYLDPSPNRPKDGLRESLLRDYWLIGRIFAVGSWIAMILYYHVAELGMKELSKHDLYLVPYMPLPVWMYTLVPTAIIGTLWLANIQGRRLIC